MPAKKSDIIQTGQLKCIDIERFSSWGIKIDWQITSKAHLLYRVKFFRHTVKKVVHYLLCLFCMFMVCQETNCQSRTTQAFKAILANQNSSIKLCTCIWLRRRNYLSTEPEILFSFLLISCDHIICKSVLAVHKYHIIHFRFLSWISVLTKSKNCSN